MRLWKQFKKCNPLYKFRNVSCREYSSEPSDGSKNPKEKYAKCQKRIFSGIQPTGMPHIGNYIGAISNWVQLQKSENDIIYSIVDLHAITTHQKPDMLRKQIQEMTIALLACGIDPEKSIIFQQSKVSQHTELNWILSCLCTMPRIEHLPQWKEKSSTQKEVGLGIFSYPVLQAADILLYKTTEVPVGDDQVKHIELASHLAKVFNNQYGIFFPKPVPVLTNTNRIKSLRNVECKMSKSEPDERSRINLDDTPDIIRSKIKKAVTDCTSSVYYDIDERPAVSNLIDIHSALTTLSPEQITQENENLDTGQYKSVLTDVIISHLSPIQSKMKELREDIGFVENVLHEGSMKAGAIAEVTMNEIKHRVGLS